MFVEGLWKEKTGIVAWMIMPVYLHRFGSFHPGIPAEDSGHIPFSRSVGALSMFRLPSAVGH
jgi:hypothetical protein